MCVCLWLWLYLCGSWGVTRCYERKGRKGGKEEEEEEVCI